MTSNPTETMTNPNEPTWPPMTSDQYYPRSARIVALHELATDVVECLPTEPVTDCDRRGYVLEVSGQWPFARIRAAKCDSLDLRCYDADDVEDRDVRALAQFGLDVARRDPYALNLLLELLAHAGRVDPTISELTNED